MRILSILFILFSLRASASVPDITKSPQFICLAKNIYYEAGAENFEGKVSVAQITLNRVKAGKFGNSICGVVQQKLTVGQHTVCQFSWACDPSKQAPIKSSQNWTESVQVANRVLFDGFRLHELNSALYFHNSALKPNWNLQRVASIGNQTFYSPAKNN